MIPYVNFTIFWGPVNISMPHFDFFLSLLHTHISLLAVEEEKYGRIFLLLSLTAHISLFPLLHQPAGMYMPVPVHKQRLIILDGKITDVVKAKLVYMCVHREPSANSCAAVPVVVCSTSMWQRP